VTNKAKALFPIRPIKSFDVLVGQSVGQSVTQSISKLTGLFLFRVCSHAYSFLIISCKGSAASKKGVRSDIWHGFL